MKRHTLDTRSAFACSQESRAQDSKVTSLAEKLAAVCRERLPSGTAVEAEYDVKGDRRVVRYDIDSAGFQRDNGASLMVGTVHGEWSAFHYRDSGSTPMPVPRTCADVDPLSMLTPLSLWEWMSKNAHRCTVEIDQSGHFIATLPPCSIENADRIVSSFAFSGTGDLLYAEHRVNDNPARRDEFNAGAVSPPSHPFSQTYWSNDQIQLVSVKVYQSPQPAFGSISLGRNSATDRAGAILAARIESEKTLSADAPMLVNGRLVTPSRQEERPGSTLVLLGVTIIIVAVAVLIVRKVRG